MLSFFVATVCSRLLLQQNEEKGFLHWMRNNNHFYAGDEYHFRLGLYLTHSRWVQEYNKQTRSFTVGVNKFSAYTPSEYRALLGYRQKPQNSKQKSGMKDFDLSKMMKKNDAVPEELDWRQKGVVNKIKDQGSCWAFSAIATAESSYAHKYGTLYSLSEQNLVDCTYDAHGCSGGWPGSGLDRAIFYQQGHFNSEEDYPYEGVDGACRWNPDKPIGFVDFYVGVNVDDEEDLKTKVAILVLHQLLLMLVINHSCHTQEAFLIILNVHQFSLIMQLQQLVMEQKMALNIGLFVIHGELIGEKKDISE